VRPLLALFCGVLRPLWIFGALAEDVWDRAGFAWDVSLLRAIHGYATPSRDAVMIVITGRRERLARPGAGGESARGAGDSGARRADQTIRHVGLAVRETIPLHQPA
jgi:hypothetical protein